MAAKQLVEELMVVRKQYQDILDDHKDKEIPAEKKTELEALHAKAMEMKGKIEESQAEDQKRRDMDKLSDFMDKPQYKTPRGFTSDEDGRKLLRDIGWDCKNGVLLAPTSLGKTQEMFSEDVLFGPIPDKDPEAAAYYQATRAIFQPVYRKVYEKYLRSSITKRSEAIAFSMLEPHEQKALSEGSDTAGGFLVPPDTQAELLVRVAQIAVMRRYARVQTTSRDMLQWPRVQAHATSGSIYSSGFVGDWAGETPTFTDVDPVFGIFEVALKKVRVATKLSNDFIADSVVNLLGFLAQNGAENMALVEDNGFIAGLGTALQPKGILNSGATTVDVEGTTVNTISNTTAAAGSATKLIDLVYNLPSQYLANARFVMRRAIEGKVRKLVDGQGRYHWPASGFGATPRELLGYPVENSEFVPDDGTDANKVSVFGDLGAYVIAQRAQISTVILRERFADTDQTGIILFERVGGDTWNEDAIRIGIV